MKKNVFITTCIFIFGCGIKGQTLTLVTGKKLYEHHSSVLSGAPYGYANSNAQSGYDFVNHTNVPSGNAALAANRDMVEHNGYFSWNGATYGWKFGFTSNTSNIGNFNYQGNNQTKFYLNNAVSFGSLNTVNDLMAAYDSTQAKKMDTAVVAGNVYIVKVRDSGMYLAMRITSVTNLTAPQIAALENNQQVMASVFFEFEYKYGTLCTASSINAFTTNSIICAGQSATLVAGGPGAFTFSWSNGATGPQIIVSPVANTTYTVTGTNMGCVVEKTVLQKVSSCVGLEELKMANELGIYPNPFTHSLKLVSDKGNQLIITDALGAIVFKGSIPDSGELEINTDGYAKGVYILTLSNGTHTYKKKIIKD